MSVKIKNRHRLKARDIRKYQNDLKNIFNDIFFDEKSSIETGELKGKNIIFVDGEPCFMSYENKIFFTLYGLNRYKPKRNFVVVDMGAVKFVTNGADVMAPGIVDADRDISKGDQVWICDENNHKPLAVGIALISGEDMINQSYGKAINTIHYVGDELWNYVAKSL
jgi:PUA domain protein